MKKEIAIAMLACLLSLSSSAGAIDTTANHTGTVKLSEFSGRLKTLYLKNENDFGFMDFYYGEPIEEIQEKYTIEHLWDEEWELRNLAPRAAWDSQSLPISHYDLKIKIKKYGCVCIRR